MSKDVLRILENAEEGMPPGYKRQRLPGIYFKQMVPVDLFGTWSEGAHAWKRTFQGHCKQFEMYEYAQ